MVTASSSKDCSTPTGAVGKNHSSFSRFIDSKIQALFDQLFHGLTVRKVKCLNTTICFANRRVRSLHQKVKGLNAKVRFLNSEWISQISFTFRKVIVVFSNDREESHP